MKSLKNGESRSERRANLLERYRKSGTNQKSFCQDAGISVSSLQGWLRAERASASTFTELGVTETRAPRTVVELVFPDGVALRIRSE